MPIIDSETKNFSSLLFKGFYAVPWHQRSYDWSREHVNELLRDIHDAVKNGNICYFLGSIMLIKQEENKWEINDGQQRMVTFSLICAHLCRFFHGESEKAHESRALRLLFDISEVDDKTLHDADKLPPRLTPPQNDRRQYHPMIRNKNVGRNGKLTDAWNTIETFFSGMDKKQKIEFFNFLISKVEISCLYVPQNVDYNFVFEVINNRGKKLEDFDLIRNHIYSLFKVVDTSDAMRKTVHDNLEKIKIDLKSKAADYVRCFFQCEFGYLPKENFYRKVKEMIKKNKGNLHVYVYRIVEQLADNNNITIYKMISSATIQDQGHILQEFTKLSGSTETRNLSVLLREMQRYSVSFPIIFAYMRCFMNIVQKEGKKEKKKATKFILLQMHNLCSFIMRTAFVAPKFEPSFYATSFANIAKEISKKEDSFKYINIFNELLNGNDIYGILDDKQFKDLIKRPIEMRDNYRIRRFLYGINLSHQSDGDIINMEKCSIEHILPQSPEWLFGWKNFDAKTHQENFNTLGNLTLLSEKDNASGEKYNESFEYKTKVFQNSSVKITQEIAEFDDWSPDSIQKRQNELAKKAVKTWDFNKKQQDL